MLVRAGSPKAQEVAAAGLSELARGGVAELLRQQEHKVRQEELKVRQEELQMEHKVRQEELQMHKVRQEELQMHEVRQEELQMHEEEKARRVHLKKGAPCISREDGRDAGAEISPHLKKGAVLSTVGILAGGDLPSAADGSMTNHAQVDPSAPQSASSDDSLEDASANRLQAIADAGGIAPLVNLLGVGATTRARENAAGALWHLALDASNQIAIARANGIMPLVMLLEHEASALIAPDCTRRVL